MTVGRPEYLISIVHELRKLHRETEWVEFKKNNADPERMGEYISALANAAALQGKANAYLVWGIDDRTHDVVGTSFKPDIAKVGNEALENWLLHQLTPKINFRFSELRINDRPVVFMEIGAAFRHPVRFKSTEYIRVGSYKKKLRDFPEKERELWRRFDQTPFEREVAVENSGTEEVLQLLDYPAYFDLLKLPLPENRDRILVALEADEMIVQDKGGKWNITNLGAILFAKSLSDFRNLKHKAVRVILYRGESRVQTIREQEGPKGYAAGFEDLISFITNLLPSNEVIGQALRRDVPMFPDIAVRELVANAVIHQDFHATGTAPLIEILANRIEITNPGLPKARKYLPCWG